MSWPREFIGLLKVLQYILFSCQPGLCLCKESNELSSSFSKCLCASQQGLAYCQRMFVMLWKMLSQKALPVMRGWKEVCPCHLINPLHLPQGVSVEQFWHIVCSGLEEELCATLENWDGALGISSQRSFLVVRTSSQIYCTDASPGHLLDYRPLEHRNAILHYWQVPGDAELLLCGSAFQ